MRKIVAALIISLGIASAGMPDPYYTNAEHHLMSPDEIADFVSQFNYSSMYTEDEFDCSEIAGHVEWLLENNGIETVFLVCKERPHMTLICNTTEDWMIIEVCNTDGIAEPIRDITDWRYNATPLRDVTDIYEVTGSYSAVDWWNTEFDSEFRVLK